MVRIPAFQAGCVGSIPITRSKDEPTAFAAGSSFVYGNRTQAGFGVKKMCLWHIFSRKRKAGTEREALGRRSG